MTVYITYIYWSVNICFLYVKNLLVNEVLYMNVNLKQIRNILNNATNQKQRIFITLLKANYMNTNIIVTETEQLRNRFNNQTIQKQRILMNTKQLSKHN